MVKLINAYFIILLVFGLGIGLILQAGQHFETPDAAPRSQKQALVSAHTDASASTTKPPQWLGKPLDPLPQLLIQLILILSIARIMGALFSKCGQPAVFGEMVAGIILGPSLCGWIFPDLFGYIFPGPSLDALKMLSQVGVCLFLFVVGMDLELNHLLPKARAAVLISHVSILFPYFLGVLAAIFLFADFAGPGTRFIPFALFMGISMSITAFPVLARIIEERGLTRTALGGMAITCAAINDATAWNLLIFVTAVAQADGWIPSLLRLGLVLMFIAAMWFVVKPGLSRWMNHPAREQIPLENSHSGRQAMTVALIFVLTSALATELIGIHALFGAFLAGVVMPARTSLRDYIKVRLETFSSVFLLPLFFAFTGLRTHIGLLNDSASWLICLVIILIATLGKLGGTMVAARFTGSSWSDSFALGALMNARGLMELIALNIGYDLGILSPRIFAMLVIMALVTTFLTGPLLTLIHWVDTSFSRHKSLDLHFLRSLW